MDCPDYPEEDDFEQMYAQELEMMKEAEEEFEPPDIFPPKSKRSLDFDSSEFEKNKRISVPPAQDDVTVSSSQIPSTSTNSSKGILSDCYPLETVSSVSVDKPTVEDLFGDINDIDFNEPISKRPRFDFEISPNKKQEMLIKQIVDQRNQRNVNNRKATCSYSEFREKNIKNSVSKKVPKWPFMPLTDTSNQRYYFRLRSEDFMDDEAKKDLFNVGNSGLLETNFEDLKKLALEEVLKEGRKAKKDDSDKENKPILVTEKDLWVERYKPKAYCQLLSDESTNRALLYWLKQWDKIVFNREPPGKRGQNDNSVQQWQKRDNNTNLIYKNTAWKNKNEIDDLVFKMDQHGRPHYKIALLCGPPGLGKTTLAHMLAKQAGYNVVEVNASDDRSVQAFRTQLEAATQMKAVMGAEPKPNCLILDEIDGAPQPSIDFLVKFASDKVENKGRKGNKKGAKGLLKRPIICICNDVYVPALRPLRQIAYTLNVPPTSSSRLGERLMEITRKELIQTDLGTMMALSEKTSNDIRSCLSFLHCLNSGERKVTLTQVHSANLGTKDTQQGLFSVWQTVFHYKLTKGSSVPVVSNKRSNSSNSVNSFSEASVQARTEKVRRTVHSFGDYDRLAMGVFENYLRLKTVDSSLNSIAKATKWFCYFDIISSSIQRQQVYSLYPYLVYPFVMWHLLFASINWPKLIYPHSTYEANMKSQRMNQVLHFTLLGMPAHIQAYQDRLKLLLDTIPYLLELIVPSIRPVSIQLYTPKEKNEVKRVTDVMVDYNLSYSQERTQEGSYHYKLDPDIEEVGVFGESEKSRIFSYTGKQMVSREVESEKIRRLAAKLNGPDSTSQTVDKVVAVKEVDKPAVVEEEKPTNVVPNHLQKLTPKALKKSANVVQKDFFGRVVSASLKKETTKAKTDDIVKSDVWYHFKEGYNNAVRKNVLMSDLY